MLLIDYVKNQFPLVLSQTYINGKLNNLSQMIGNILRYAPTALSTQGSEYWHADYQEKYATEHENTLLTTWLIGKITNKISLGSMDSKSRLSFWGSLPTNQEQAKELYLLQHAIIFKATGIGNCSYRASYAAIELANIFLSISVALEVKVRSYPEIDHFVVMIGSHEHGWKIYDPLTNPELIFDEEYYDNHIKTLFKPVNNPKSAFEFTISAKEIKRSELFTKKIINLLQTESAELSINALQVDDNYFNFLQLKGISDPLFQKTDEAIRHLQAISYGDSMSCSNNS